MMEEIVIFWTDFKLPYDNNTFEKLLKLLPPAQKERNNRFLRVESKINHLYGRLLLYVAFKKMGIPFRNQELKVTEYGRPYIDEDIDFNISHSKETVVCAISKGQRVGIDIEGITTAKLDNFKGTMNDEQWISIIESDHKYHKFFKIWTQKESVLKLDGRGILYPLDKINIDGSKCYTDEWVYFQKEVKIKEGFKCFVSSINENFEFKLKKVSISDFLELTV